MIEISYDQMRNEYFARGLAKIATCPTFSTHTAYGVAKIVQEIELAKRVANEKFMALLNEYASKDEKGNFVPNKNEAGEEVQGTFVIPPEKEVEWREKGIQVNNTIVKINRQKLTLHQLEGAQLTAQEIMALEPIIDETIGFAA